MVEIILLNGRGWTKQLDGVKSFEILALTKKEKTVYYEFGKEGEGLSQSLTSIMPEYSLFYQP